MEKVIAHFFCNEINDKNETLSEFFIVRELKTKSLSVKCLVSKYGLKTNFNYTIRDFENTWKINLADLELSELIK